VISARVAPYVLHGWNGDRSWDVFYSVSRMNADKTRVDKRSLLTAVARLFRGIDLQVGVYGGGWIYARS
jgi:hypothetical protein